jgi:hypothetical protein
VRPDTPTAGASAPDLFGAPAPVPGFWIRDQDAGRTFRELAARGWTVSVACSACGHVRQWDPEHLARLPAEATVGGLAARLVCHAAGCGSRRGTVSVLRPPRRGRGGRRHLSARDIERIKVMAAKVSETCQPPVLDDLDAPIRVGACLPGQETYLGAQVVVPWNGRLILGWTLGRKARNARRGADDWSA